MRGLEAGLLGAPDAPQGPVDAAWKASYAAAGVGVSAEEEARQLEQEYLQEKELEAQLQAEYRASQQSSPASVLPGAIAEETAASNEVELDIIPTPRTSLMAMEVIRWRQSLAAAAAAASAEAAEAAAAAASSTTGLDTALIEAHVQRAIILLQRVQAIMNDG